ncbi:Trm112 family protein [Geobacter sulfurreducens]|uniref:Trm112 family protein n=1 Tax=Geobacter sulfurreducens TaxID=35554 RepID=UPI0005D99D45|nr:Trm112 family protein [Geobacter sulfurreducens]AJY68489.1 hypothetical protein RW64_02220 [Geobacter sulfurreducens]BBA70701.1 hypothetical protein YM18_2183 [Geobacter sulfurreducens]
MALSIKLFEILACPRCTGEVKPVNNGSALVCEACRLRFPVRDDIPVMLLDEAERIGDR